MHIDSQDKTRVRVRIGPDEAARLLGGLRERGDELGEDAVALAQALTEAGVTPFAPPDHVRTEYMPPD